MLYGGVQLGTLRLLEPAIGKVGTMCANLPVSWVLILLSLLWEFRLQEKVSARFPRLKWEGPDNPDPVFSVSGILVAWVLFTIL